MLIVCGAASSETNDPSDKSEEGSCSADDKEGMCSGAPSDMVPRGYLTEALEQLKKFDQNLQKKDQLIKDIRSRFKYLKKQIKDLQEEKEVLVKHEEELNETIRKITDIVPDYGQDLVHSAWRLNSDLKICKEDLELKEREEDLYNKDRAQFVRDLASMHRLETECRKEVRKFREKEKIPCKEAGTMYKQLRDIALRTKQGKSVFKTDIFEHEVVRALGNCVVQASMEGATIKKLKDEGEKVAKMEEFCGQMRHSLDSCIDETTDLRDRLERAKFDNGQLSERLGLCESWVEILNTFSGIDVLTPDEMQQKMETASGTEDDVKIEVESETEPVEDVVAPEASNEQLKASLRMYNPEERKEPEEQKTERKKPWHVMPWKPEEVPDVSNMSDIKEVRKIFDHLKEDYTRIHEAAVDADEYSINCMRQRQDAVVMKYFTAKELHQTKYQLEVAEELQKDLEAKCDTKAALNQQDCEKCLDELKETRRQAAIEGKELRQARESQSKLEKDVEEAVKEADKQKSLAQQNEFLAKGTQIVLQDMEEKDSVQKERLSRQEKEIDQAIRSKQHFVLFDCD
jgi:hypothetical protein